MIADAAGALRARLDELTPGGAPRRDGVHFADEATPHEDPDRPLRKLRRWLVGDWTDHDSDARPCPPPAAARRR